MPPPVSQKQAKSAPVPKKATAKKPSWKWTSDSDEEVAPEQLPHTPAPDDMPVHQPAFNRNADLDALLARKRALDREKEAIAAAIASLPLRAPQEPPAPTLVHEVEVQEPPAPIASPVAEVPPRVSTTPKRRGSSAVSASPGPEDVDDIFICRCSDFNCLLREDLSTLDAYQWMKAPMASSSQYALTATLRCTYATRLERMFAGTPSRREQRRSTAGGGAMS